MDLTNEGTSTNSVGSKKVERENEEIFGQRRMEVQNHEETQVHYCLASREQGEY